MDPHLHKMILLLEKRALIHQFTPPNPTISDQFHKYGSDGPL